MDIVTNVINFLIDLVHGLFDLLFGWLPNCPILMAINNTKSLISSEFLGYINYFLPVSEVVAIMAAWLVGVIGYYTVSLILRWVKAVS